MKDPSSKTNLDFQRFGGGDNRENSGHFWQTLLFVQSGCLPKDKMLISVIFNVVYMNPWKCK